MLILEYEHLFPNIPTRTNQIYHDADIDGSEAMKQHPYRMNLMKLQYLRKEIQYLLHNDFIKPSQSNWSSLCIHCQNQMEHCVCALTIEKCIL